MEIKITNNTPDTCIFEASASLTPCDYMMLIAKLETYIERLKATAESMVDDGRKKEIESEIERIKKKMRENDNNIAIYGVKL